MKLFRVAALSVLLTGPAYAQMPQMNIIPETPSKTMEQVEQEQARDKAYKDTLKTIPDAKASSDPWGGVRSDAPKAATTKSATAPKAKAKLQAKVQAKSEAKTDTQAPAAAKQ
jgi:hypothetical protein